MIMSMYRVLCVTNRKLAGERFLEQIEKAVMSGVEGIILREKDLPENEYEQLAVLVNQICEERQIPLILHTYIDVAKKLHIRRIHLPMHMFLNMGDEQKQDFDVIGVSTHSVEEAATAWKAGASYITAGHVFVTDCKKGVPPRGIEFLREVCDAVPIPVYAIGGIHSENAGDCIRAGAAGVCLMSAFMKAEKPFIL